jgi:hypothetical protein
MPPWVRRAASCWGLGLLAEGNAELFSTCCRRAVFDCRPSLRLPIALPRQAGDLWIGTLNLRFSKQAAPMPAHHGGQQALGAPTGLLPLPFLGGTFNSTYNAQQPIFKFVTPRRLKRAVITSVITGGWGGKMAWL